jgi:nucleotide-binding universal stress UspA family protein
VKIQQIVVATDFSEHANRALEAAVELAKRYGAALHIVHAYHMPVLVGMPDEVALPPSFWSGVKEAAASRLEKTLSDVRAGGVRAVAHLREANPSDAILDVAREVGADLIVMGTRGLTGLKHVLLGSVAERTLRLAPCSVLSVKSESVT